MKITVELEEYEYRMIDDLIANTLRKTDTVGASILRPIREKIQNAAIQANIEKRKE